MHVAAPAIVLTTKESESPSVSTWDLASLDGEGNPFHNSSNPPLRSSTSKGNQMIKNSMPSVLNRPSNSKG